MPILEVEMVVAAGEEIRGNLTGAIAESAAQVFGSPAGGTWVRLRLLPSDRYAEDSGGPPSGVLPVFVRVLKAELPSPSALQREVRCLTEAIAEVTNRPAENVHIQYEPPARGRLAFGGKIVEEHTTTPKLYTELASWWPLLSAPADYAEEAELYRRTLVEACPQPPKTVLELGSGGGNNASHLKAYFEMTLVDLSEQMLAVSQELNPECEHIQGDMRSIRLGRQFDAVFVHDAIMYMTSETDLRRAIETAYQHCRPGGAALFVPDCVKETFVEHTSQGGHNGERRSLRYLSWDYDPDPEDSTTITDFAYLLRDERGTEIVHDQHILGLFPATKWIEIITESGFYNQRLQFELQDTEGGWGTAFLGIKPSG